MADLSQYTPANISSEDKTWGLIMYLFPIMAPVTLFAMKDKLNSKYVHFHAIQCMGWFVTALILSCVTCGIFGAVVMLGNLFFAWKAYQGEMFEIPVLTDQLANRGYFDPVKQLNA